MDRYTVSPIKGPKELTRIGKLLKVLHASLFSANCSIILVGLYFVVGFGGIKGYDKISPRIKQAQDSVTVLGWFGKVEDICWYFISELYHFIMLGNIST